MLVDEGDGNGGGGIIHLSVLDNEISVVKCNCLEGDDLGFSCATRLRILAGATQKNRLR